MKKRDPKIKCFTEEVLLLEHRLGVMKLMVGGRC
jgi:hypothetical protein